MTCRILKGCEHWGLPYLLLLGTLPPPRGKAWASFLERGSRCPSLSCVCVRVCVCVCDGLLLSRKKEHIWVSANQVNEPRAYYTEWSKSEKEEQISYINTYVWNLERWYWWTIYRATVKMGDADIENRLMDTERVRGEEREGGTKAESNMEA